MLITLNIIGYTYVLGQFKQVGNDILHSNLHRAKNAFIDNARQIETTMTSWSQWDDAYRFMKTHDQAFMASNFGEATLANHKLNFMAFYSIDDKWFDGRYRAPGQTTYSPFPSFLLTAIERHRQKLLHGADLKPVTGIIKMGAYYTFFTSQAILTSDLEGPRAGTLLVGRFLTNNELRRLESLTQMNLAIYDIDHPDDNGHWGGIQNQLLSGKQHVFIAPVSEEKIDGHIIVEDIYHRPAFVLEVTNNRVVYQQGKKALIELTIVLLCLFALKFGVTYFSLDAIVLKRIALLSRDVQGVANGQPHIGFVHGADEDEIYRLSEEMDKMVDSLRDAQEKALEANKAKRDFLANMSHELRTPLNGVMGMAALLDMTPLDDDQRNYVQTIQYSSQALLQIISDVLDFSKIEAGKVEIETIEFDLYYEVQQLSLLMANRIYEKSVEFMVHFAPHVPQKVMGDPTRIRQVLFNLLSNACKFTSEGHILLDIDYHSISDSEGCLCFSVEDTGIGLSEEQKFKIFEQFTQADNSTTRQYGGTGLGLSITQQLVGLMGGEMGVISESGKGTRFWVMLPTSPVGLATDNVVTAKEGDTHKPLQVVVISNQFDMQQLIGDYLRTWHVPFIQCLTAQEALSRLNQLDVSEASAVMALWDERLPNIEPLQQLQQSWCQSTSLSWVKMTALPPSAESNQDPLSPRVLPKPILPDKLRAVLLDTTSGVTRQALSASQSQTLVSSVKVTSPQEIKPNLGRVLIVEDNATNQKVVGMMLKRLGYEAEFADDGKVALDKVSAHDPGYYHVVLMDCQMPVMDGYEATRKIRFLKTEAAFTPIIALTGNVMAGETERCFDEGMDDFLSKPVALKLLDEKLGYWSARKSDRAIRAV